MRDAIIDSEVFEMRGVRGFDENGKRAWVQVRDDNNGVRLATGTSVCIISVAAARRLADNLLELASRAEGRTQQ